MVSEKAPPTERKPTEAPNRSSLEAQPVTLEFTVEPFVDSHPGPHVRAAIAAASGPDLAVDIGPFGTVVSGPDRQVFKATHEILTAAFSSGATRVSLQVTSE